MYCGHDSTSEGGDDHKHWLLAMSEVLMQNAKKTLIDAFMLSKWCIVILAYKGITFTHSLPTFSQNLTIKWYYHFIMFINLNWSLLTSVIANETGCTSTKPSHGKIWSSQGKPDTVGPNNHYDRQLCSQITRHFTSRHFRMLKRPFSPRLCCSKVTHYFSSANSEMFHRFRLHSIII